MAQPEEKQYTERPRKVLAAAYDPAADPIQRGVVVTDASNPAPHVHINRVGWVEHFTLEPGHMMVWDAALPDLLIAVMTVAEFEARYGNAPTVTGG